MEEQNATVLVIDSYDVARAETAAQLREDGRFLVEELSDPSTARDYLTSRRHEVYVDALERDPSSTCSRVKLISLADTDAVIAVLDDRWCVSRAQAILDAGATFYFVPPLGQNDLHQVASHVYRVRNRPTQFGNGVVRVRFDVGKLVVGKQRFTIGPKESAILLELCLLRGRWCPIDRLLKAGGYRDDEAGRAALARVFDRLRKQLGSERSRLICAGSLARLELDS